MSSTVTDGVAASSTGSGARASVTDLLLVTMAVIWGVNASVMKAAVGQMPPLVFNAARMGLASIALVALAFGARRVVLSRRDVTVLLALGVLGTGLYQFFMIEGLARTRAGTTALILSSGPAFVALFGRALGIERITRRGMVGIALSMMGIALVALMHPDESSRRTTLLGSASNLDALGPLNITLDPAALALAGANGVLGLRLELTGGLHQYAFSALESDRAAPQLTVSYAVPEPSLVGVASVAALLLRRGRRQP